MYSKQKKIKIVTLGCAKNLYDSEMLLGILKNSQYEICRNENDESDIVIINTCGFIESAKEESINTILEYVDLKKRNIIEKVFVIGCLSQRYKNDLEKEIPEIDQYFGNKNIKEIIKSLKIDYRDKLINERELIYSKNYAYLKISEGCDRVCSFCAIPFIRGKHISRPIEDIVSEAETLANKGVKEIILIAQDTTFYGMDLYGERKLADLLKELVKIEKIEWIRLHYAFPTGFPEDVLDVMAKENKICKYLDIPLQHISNDLLKSMKRGTDKEKTTQLINKIREKIPNVAIRTTFILGYPNETKEQFEELKQWIKDQKFDRLGCFTYSHEEGTEAYKLEDNISEKEKLSRKNEIMEIQKQISYEINLEKIGKRYKVIIEDKDGDFYYGRTEFDSPEVDNDVIIDASKFNLKIGEFVIIEVTSAGEYDIFGVPVA